MPGHPTGRGIARDDCFIHLRMFVRYAAQAVLVESESTNREKGITFGLSRIISLLARARELRAAQP